MSLEVGTVIEGVITGITNFGAFVELPDGKVGMIHISEIANGYVEDIRQFLKEKDKVRVKVLGKNDRGKYDLSIKQVDAPGDGERPKRPERPPMLPVMHRKGRRDKSSIGGSGDMMFEDKLARFLKESEERLLDLKRNTEAKRGRGRSSR